MIVWRYYSPTTQKNNTNVAVGLQKMFINCINGRAKDTLLQYSVSYGFIVDQDYDIYQEP